MLLKGNKMNCVFVYGTLMKGFSNSPILEDQEFLGLARTKEENYNLFHIDCYAYPFPGLVQSDKYHNFVYGEIYAVNDKCLQLLDSIECIDQGLYRRESMIAVDQYGTEYECFVYLFNQNTDLFRSLGVIWDKSRLSNYAKATLQVKEVQVSSEETCLVEQYCLNYSNGRQATPLFKSKQELSEYCKANKFKFQGFMKTESAWNPSLFSLETKQKLQEKKRYVVIDESIGSEISEVFDSLKEVKNWFLEKDFRLYGKPIQDIDSFVDSLVNSECKDELFV